MISEATPLLAAAATGPEAPIPIADKLIRAHPVLRSELSSDDTLQGARDGELASDEAHARIEIEAAHAEENGSPSNQFSADPLIPPFLFAVDMIVVAQSRIAPIAPHVVQRPGEQHPMCVTCFATIAESEPLVACPAGHSMCADCIQRWVATRVEVRSATIKCCVHECPAAFAFASLAACVPPALLRRLESLAATLKDPHVRVCPRNGCFAAVRRTRSDAMTCHDCGLQFCYLHGMRNARNLNFILILKIFFVPSWGYQHNH
jgi:hypothetical protein